jgi:hypothetical protein
MSTTGQPVPKTTVSSLVKKSFSCKLEKSEIHRLIRLGYYSRPISKATQTELEIKDSELTEQRCLRRIRKHPLLNPEKSAKPEPSKSKTHSVSKKNSPDIKSLAHKSKTTTRATDKTPSDPEKSKGKDLPPKKAVKQPKPVEASNSIVLNSIKASVPPLLPCDDCLLPFSKLTSTTLPHVSFLCGTPMIDRSIFSKCLSSRLSQIKTHLRKSGLTRSRLPKQVVSDQVHLLQRSILLELNNRKDKKTKPAPKEKKAKKSKTQSAPDSNSPQKRRDLDLTFVPAKAEIALNALTSPAPAADAQFDKETELRDSRRKIAKQLRLYQAETEFKALIKIPFSLIQPLLNDLNLETTIVEQGPSYFQQRLSSTSYYLTGQYVPESDRTLGTTTPPPQVYMTKEYLAKFQAAIHHLTQIF